MVLDAAAGANPTTPRSDAATGAAPTPTVIPGSLKQVATRSAILDRIGGIAQLDSAKETAQHKFMQGVLAKHLNKGVSNQVFTNSVLVALKMVQNGVNNKNGNISKNIMMGCYGKCDENIVKMILADAELRAHLEVICVHENAPGGSKLSFSLKGGESYTSHAKKVQDSLRLIAKMDDSLQDLAKAIFPHHASVAADVVRLFQQHSPDHYLADYKAKIMTSKPEAKDFVGVDCILAEGKLYKLHNNQVEEVNVIDQPAIQTFLQSTKNEANLTTTLNNNKWNATNFPDTRLSTLIPLRYFFLQLF